MRKVLTQLAMLAVASLGVLAGPPRALAQQGSGSVHAQSHEVPRYEVFGGYSYVREDGANLNGWCGVAEVNVNHWFGLAADFDGHYGARSLAEGREDIRAHAVTFGPHVSYRNRSKVTPFGFVLVGVAHERTATPDHVETETGFAMNTGGGIDVHVGEAMSVRVLQIDAAYTRFGGHGTTAPRLSFGLVFHFGKRK